MNVAALLLSLALLIGGVPMKQVLCYSRDGNFSTSATRYFDLVGGMQLAQGSDNGEQVIWPCSGSWRNLVIELSVAPGAGKSWTFTVMVDGVDTPMVVTISDTNTTGRYTSADVAFTAFSRIRLKIVPSGTPAAAVSWRWSIEWEGSTPNESGYAADADGVNVATGLFPLFGGGNYQFNATLDNKANVVGAAGSITGLAVRFSSATGGGVGYNFHVVKNGVVQDGTGGTVDTTCAGIGTQQATATFNLPVVGGDVVYVQSTRVGSPGGRSMSIGARFLATTDGESQFCGNPDNPTTGTVEYASARGVDNDWIGTEGFEQQCLAGVTPFTLKQLYVRQLVAAGGGSSNTYTVRKNGASTAKVVTIADAATTGVDTTNDISVVDGDLFGLQRTEAGTPASTDVAWGFVQAIGSDEEPEPEPEPPGAVTLGTGGIVEMCFHRGTSFRTWIKYRGLGDVLVAKRFWWLGDVGSLLATDDINESPMEGQSGTYEAIPTKVRGLIPEYGLATYFDGAVQRVTTSSGLSGIGGTFTLIALIRPDAAGLGSAQCIYQTGAVGSAYLGLNASNQAVFGVNGGTVLTSTLAVVANATYLVIGTYDGSEGSLFIVECEIDGAIDETGPTALTFTAAHDIGTIGSNESTEYFTGAIQHVAELEDVLDLEDVEGLHSTTYWTDVTPDVEGAITIDRGIHDDGPLARIAATGRLQLRMDNSTLNSAGLEGYYSPNHANVREGFGNGIPIRVSFFDEGSPSERLIQFIGTIRSIKPTAGIYRQRDTAVLATDWMDEAARTTLRGLPVQANVTADEVVAVILNSMRNRPHAIDLETGSDTYVRALHNTTDEKTPALAELRKVSESELGLFYVRGDGTAVFEARGTRAALTTVDYTLTNFLDVDQDDASEKSKNLIKVTVHPARLSDDPAQVLYSNDAMGSPADPSIQLDNGVNLEVFLPFRDLSGQETQRIGATSIVTPVAGIDYQINTAEDGSGTDVTSNPLITVTFTLGGNGVYLRATNAFGQRVWFTFLEIRGRAVYDFEPITAIAKNANDIDEHGEQEASIDMPYQSQAGIGQGAADYLLNAFRDRSTHVKSVTLWGDASETHRDVLLRGDISTRIAASELMSGVDGEFFVNAKRIEWKPSGEDGLRDIDVTFWLADASTGSFWILDESALDETTRLAYL